MRMHWSTAPDREVGIIVEADEARRSMGGLVGTRPVLKRPIDLVIASIVLFLLAPVMLGIAALIRMGSPGPVLFRQVRMGRGGRTFQIFKFRTMVVDAERQLAELESRNESPGGILFEMKDDPRITRLGKFLRRSSLDELPQLINVLLGEMSLVGPRPLQLRDCERLEMLDPAGFSNRLVLLPGLTGLAQISGRRGLDPGRILELDREYVRSVSVSLDFVIIWRTFFAVVSGQGAC